jgi:hypothetical protein
MNLGRELKSGWRMAASLFQLGLWVVGTVWLGGSALWRFGRLIGRAATILGQTMRCPRGHIVPVYGVFECRCGALHEGWVFGRCRVCRQTAGWTPCPRCKLPVRSPLL